MPITDDLKQRGPNAHSPSGRVPATDHAARRGTTQRALAADRHLWLLPESAAEAFVTRMGGTALLT
ncbi:hypothetical protein ABT173_43860, partial [Streptomyces sp. NPDC001795]|uniref:hypothetical protein n=1 Tax=Streptomyces sp. NPDC001795 TaxID=3154525 RepID=UPI003324D7C3